MFILACSRLKHTVSEVIKQPEYQLGKVYLELAGQYFGERLMSSWC